MTPTTTCFNFADGTQRSLPVPAIIFSGELQLALMHHLAVGYQAQRRQYTRQVKNRSQVRGGGRKPWKQKGTGRARQGSIRAPQWRGGAVVFGPQANQHPRFKINRRCYQAGLKMILRAKVAQQELFMGEHLVCPSGKTKDAKALFAKHPTPLLNTTTLVISDDWPLLLRRATANLAGLTLTTARLVHPYQLLAHHIVILTPAAWPILVARCR